MSLAAARLLLVATSAFAADSPPVDVVFEARTGLTRWAVEVEGDGRAVRSDRDIVLTLDSLTFKTRFPQEIRSYRACLAYAQSETVWDLAACSEYVTFRLSTDNYASTTIQPAPFLIPAKPVTRKKNAWFVIQVMTGEDAGSEASSFNHSRDADATARLLGQDAGE